MRIEGIRTDWAPRCPSGPRVVEAVRRCDCEATRRIEPALALLECAPWTRHDRDGDGVPDAFDPDVDGDGLLNALDRGPFERAVGRAQREEIAARGRKRDSVRRAYLPDHPPLGGLLNLLV